MVALRRIELAPSEPCQRTVERVTADVSLVEVVHSRPWVGRFYYRLKYHENVPPLALICDEQGAIRACEFTLTTDLPTVRCATPPAVSLGSVQDGRPLVDMAVWSSIRKRPAFVDHPAELIPYVYDASLLLDLEGGRQSSVSWFSVSPQLRVGFDANHCLSAVLFPDLTKAEFAALAI